MAGVVRVRLVAEDKASPVVKQFAANTQSSFANVATTVQKSTASVNKSVTSIGNTTAASSIKVSSFLKQLTGFGTAAIAANKAAELIKSAFSEAFAFESAIARINTLGAALTDPINVIQARLRELGPEFGNQTELAGALFTAITTGAENTDKALKIVELSAKLAKGQLSDLNATTKLTQQISAAYALQTDELEGKMNKLVKVTQVGNITFESMIQPLGQLIPTAERAGVSVEDAGNAIGTLAIVMGSTDRAGTALNNMLLQSIKRQGQLREAGIDVMKALGQGGIIGLMEEFRRVADGNVDTLLELVPSIRAFRAAGVLTGPMLEKLKENMDKVNASGDDLTRNFDLMKNTTSGAWTVMVNSAKNAASSMFNDSVDIQNALIAIANAFITVENNGNRIQGLFGGIAGSAMSLVAALGTLGEVATKMGQGIIVPFTEIGRMANQAISSVAGFAAKAADKMTDARLGIGDSLRGISDHFQDSANIAGGWTKKVLESDDALEQFNLTVGAEAVTAFENAASAINKDVKQRQLLDFVTRQGTQALKDNGAAQKESARSAQESTESLAKQGEVYKKVTIDGKTFYQIIGESSDKTTRQIAKDNEEVQDSMEETAKVVEESGKSIANSFKNQAKVIVSLDSPMTLLRRAAGELGISMEELKEKIKEAGDQGKQLSVVLKTGIQKPAEDTARAVDLAWKDVMGDTKAEIERKAKLIMQTFRTLEQSGTAPPAVIAEKWDQEMEKVKGLLGPNSPIVKEMEAMGNRLTAKAAGTVEGVAAQFKKLGITINVPIENGVRDAIRAFTALEGKSGVTKKFLQENAQKTADFISEQGGRVPQRWIGAYGVIEKRSKETQENASKDFRTIGTEGEDAASRVQNAFEKAANAQGSIAERFKGTWVEKLDEIGRKAEETGKRVEDSTKKVGIDTSSGTHTDAQGNEITETGRFSLENTQTSENVQALLNDLRQLDEALRTTVGTAPHVQAARKLYLDEIRKVKDRLRQLGFDEQGNPLNDAPGGGGRVGGQANEPSRPSRSMGVSGTPFEETIFGQAQELERQIREAKALQEQITKPLKELFEQLRSGESEADTLRRIAEDLQTKQAASGLTSMEATRLRDTLNTINMLEGTVSSVRDQIAAIRQREFQYVEEIARLEAEKASLLEGIQPQQAVLPEPVTTTTGPTQSTDSNTEATNNNTDSLDRLTDKLGDNTGMRLDGPETGAFGVPSLGGRDLSLRPGGGFANGGSVAQTGVFQLEQGETVIPRQGSMTGTGVTFLGRGETTVSSGPGNAVGRHSITQTMGGVDQHELAMLNVLYSQGRVEDILGPRGQAQIAAAIVAPTKQMIRRRDIMADLTRNTPLSQQGRATVK